MERRDWLLMLLEEELDPIRIQKGMFLFAMESGSPPSEVYKFIPYNWGPCCFDIYDDLENLHSDGLIERRPVPGKGWFKYQITPAGTSRAKGLSARKSSRDYLHEVKRIIKQPSFDELLREVYAKYPDYTAKSLFRS